MTHKLAYNISLFLCKKGTIEKEDIDIYTYGFEVLMDSIIETILLLVAGAILGHVFETVFFICAFGVLRSFTGGYHASSKIVCTTMTLSTCVINLWLACIISKFTRVIKVLGVVGALVIWLCAPKAHANKPLDDTQRKQNQTISRVLCVIYVIGMLVLKHGFATIGNVLSVTLFQVAVLLLGKEDVTDEEST